MTKADLIALAERVERADAAQQDEMLRLAFKVIHGGSIGEVMYRHGAFGENPDSVARIHVERFAKMLDAEAYESAAMTLVPSPGKWSITAGHADDWQAAIWFEDGRALDWRSAATPSLALTTASLRAIAEEMD